MDAPKDLPLDRDAVVLSMGNSGTTAASAPSSNLFDTLSQRFQALTTNQRLLMGAGVLGLVLALVWPSHQPKAIQTIACCSPM